MSTHQRATVRVLTGPRAISDFIASAGLGISGVGTWELYTVDYKPGEVVTRERVAKAFDSMIAESDKAGVDFKILRYEIADIVTVNAQV